jgi:hypothetical protein
VTHPAEAFSKQVLFECSKAQVQKLIQEYLEGARAFAFLLWIVSEELRPASDSNGKQIAEALSVQIAAEAVQCEVRAYRNQRPFVTGIE